MKEALTCPQKKIFNAKVKVTVLSDSLQPHGLYSPWNSPGKNTGVELFPSPRDLHNPGSPALEVDSTGETLNDKDGTKNRKRTDLIYPLLVLQ